MTVLQILSLGAGVQSTTMALMAAHGEITPMPDCAVFADTGWEPKAVYRHLEWLRSANVLPFPVHVVSNGNIREMLTRAKPGRYAAVPFFLDNGPGKPKGMGRRQCTHEFKLKPLMWKARELLGKGRKESIAAGSVIEWVGISTDEATRMKPSKVKWKIMRWPLIEARMSRGDCYEWLKRHDYPTPPKSACIGCPFHSNEMWRAIRDQDPESWDDAIEVDRIIRSGGTKAANGREGQQYMHASLKPLGKADLGGNRNQYAFDMECEGICGV